MEMQELIGLIVIVALAIIIWMFIFNGNEKIVEFMGNLWDMVTFG